MNDNQRKLLEDLADLLENLDPEIEHEGKKFNMGTWSCGSSACAVGHAYHFLPSWREAGLEMTQDDFFPQPVFRNKYDFEAVAALLGISLFEAQALLDPDFYNDNDNEVQPWEVAFRITAFLTGELA